MSTPTLPHTTTLHHIVKAQSPLRIFTSTPTLPHPTTPHYHGMITPQNTQMSTPTLPHPSTPESSTPRQWIAPVPP